MKILDKNSLPSSIQAEKAALGCLLLEPNLWDDLATQIEEFFGDKQSVDKLETSSLEENYSAYLLFSQASNFGANSRQESLLGKYFMQQTKSEWIDSLNAEKWSFKQNEQIMMPNGRTENQASTRPFDVQIINIVEVMASQANSSKKVQEKLKIALENLISETQHEKSGFFVSKDDSVDSL